MLRPAHTPEELRAVQRAEIEAVDTAIAKYQEFDPDAPREKVAASRTALMLIANAIRVNTDWLPDA